ncbi:MAG: diguanylate cyclase [Candidatus Accumulibacter sp.]|jgi:diguanylate cyclase (GGDEF)-like protein/hemerythrin-like metal-binding protein|nr:diguanylate cyclase [Accumulibacter sp.]
MKKTILSGLSLRVLLVLMEGTLVVLAISFAGRLDQTHAVERYAFMGVGLLLILTVLASMVFFIRLNALRMILRRLDSLLEKYSLHKAPENHPVLSNDECEQISLALELLEENMAARERGERDLREHERISASILGALHQSVVVADSRGSIILFSQGAEAMLGYSADEMIGKQTPMLFHDPGEVRQRAEELTDELCIPVVVDTYTLIAKALATGQVDEREWTYIRKDGTRLTVLASITVFFDDLGNVMCCHVATDITERSRAAAEITRLANYDPLTQLPNRRLFHDRLHMAIFQARRKGAKFGLLMIDLDRFKPVNDQYGHSVGDILLSAVAERLQKCLRESDTLARVGGDEFVAILPMVGDARDAARVARKLRRALCSPFALTDDITVNIDCSVGIAVYPDHGDEENTLLKKADDAMYVAKSMGRSKVYFAEDAAQTKTELAVHKYDSRDGDPLMWRHSYQCGEETIDRQHKNVFTHCNSIILAIEDENFSLDKLPEMIDNYISDLTEHFQYEEAMLARHAYPGLEAHSQIHRALLDRAWSVHRQAVAGDLSMDDLLLFVEWNGVVQHLLTDDHDFFPFLKKALQQDLP